MSPHIKKNRLSCPRNSNLEKYDPYLLDFRFSGNDAVWVTFHVGWYYTSIDILICSFRGTHHYFFSQTPADMDMSLALIDKQMAYG